MTKLRDYFTFQSMTLTSDSRLRLFFLFVFLSKLIYPLDFLTNYLQRISAFQEIISEKINKIKILISGDVILLFVTVPVLAGWVYGFMFFMSRNTRSVCTINRATFGSLAKPHPDVVSLLRRADSGSRLDDGCAKAQSAVVLILKRLGKQGHGFKSHPTDWEKPGIEPRGAPGLQGTCYRRRDSLVCGRVPWL